MIYGCVREREEVGLTIERSCQVLTNGAYLRIFHYIYLSVNYIICIHIYLESESSG